jgi:hypothetical protein
MNVDDASPTDAQGVLVQLLLTALRDYEKCAAVMHGALQSAAKEKLPEDASALVDFATAHLVPLLTKEMRPNLVLEFLNDLRLGLYRLSRGTD